MEENAKAPLTAVDRIADGKGLQMAKAAIPYLPASMQKAFSVYIKMMEVSNLLSYYSNPVHACSAPSASPEEILNDILPYCNDAQRQSVDQAVNLMTTLKMYQEFQKM
ncbi:hypothetical protein [Marvinbryantia formatexigens]|nr:hypothetical protein [Marvinbryantia formatexigens]UWO24426.1 hypothetical protein NQ534_18725 [Marvinbryantia formatexigens DSM 14469]SDF07134.1 hypothetical protein SAMN05660368_00012 [Marvinbryantia formatexigens]